MEQHNADIGLGVELADCDTVDDLRQAQSKASFITRIINSASSGLIHKAQRTTSKLQLEPAMISVIKNYYHWLHGKWPAGKPEKLPAVNEDGSTNVPGLWVVGDLTGIPPQI